MFLGRDTSIHLIKWIYKKRYIPITSTEKKSRKTAYKNTILVKLDVMLKKENKERLSREIRSRTFTTKN